MELPLCVCVEADPGPLPQGLAVGPLYPAVERP